MQFANTIKYTLEKSCRYRDLRYFVRCMFVEKISRENSAFYDQLANVEEYI